MSDRVWTAAQTEAIEYRGQNLILSAAAGSGKTATLTERIIRLIKSGEATLDRMLIVTFTIAAAGELRSRIGDALSRAASENPSDRGLIKQLTLLEGAKISTIHSFFKGEITPYANRLGISPDFRVLDTVESAELKKDAMEETAAYFFSLEGEERETFERLCDSITDAKNEANFVKNMLSVREGFVNKGLAPEEIRKCADFLMSEADIMESDFYSPVLSQIKGGLAYFRQLFERLHGQIKLSEDAGALLPTVENCLSHVYTLSEAVEIGYGEMHSLTASFKLADMTRKRNLTDIQLKEELAELKSEFGDFVKSDIKPYFSLGLEKMANVRNKTAELLYALAGFLEQFEKNFSASKKERNALDYSDMEQFAHELFVDEFGGPTPLAKEVGKKFDYVFIDEYQDTNAVQDSVFSAISGEASRFMVGDVKQSIYAFRGARPDVFLGYRRRYEGGDGGDAIFMSENFRSDSGVIDFSNLVSDYIFSGGSTPFEEEDKLICKKSGVGSCPCEICLVQKPSEEDKTEENEEAAYVASRIVELLREGSLENGERIRPCDIAILLRGGTHAEDFAKSLILRGVPVTNSISENLFSYGEVLLVLCMLRATDNPLHDIYLAGAMKSPLCGFTLEELVKIRKNTNEPLWYNVRSYAKEGNNVILRTKAEEFCKMLGSWREAARELDADEILRLIIEETGILRYSGDERRSAADIARSIKILLSHSAVVAKNGGVLHDLVVYLETLTSEKDKSAVPPAQNSVSIMTIHASKGLEFPVCFICDTAKRLVSGTRSGPVVSHGNSVAMKICDDGGLVRCNTPLVSAIRAAEGLSELDEEARILYVAMTRARERLYISCKAENVQKALNASYERSELPLSDYTVKKATSAAQWILDAAVRKMGEDCFKIVEITTPASTEKYESQADERKFSEEFDSFFENILDFTYSKDYLCNIPAKLVVSKLAPDVLDSEERGSLDRGSSRIIMPKEAPKPAFLSSDKVSGADIGTATHMFMQFCNWEKLGDLGVKAELSRLVEKGYITAEQGDMVDISQIELFLKSSLFQRLKGAKSVLRERRFNAILDAFRFTENEELKEKLKADGVKLTVQGVVDCMFCDFDGKYVLVDYKTDKLSPKELSNPSLGAKKLLDRHKSQLEFYRDICQELMGIVFDEVYIYSLPLGKCIEVD